MLHLGGLADNTGEGVDGVVAHMPRHVTGDLTALADDIILHMFMARELYDLYFNEPKGLMNIDINVHTGAPHVLYHNELLFATTAPAGFSGRGTPRSRKRNRHPSMFWA